MVGAELRVLELQCSVFKQTLPSPPKYILPLSNYVLIVGKGTGNLLTFLWYPEMLRGKIPDLNTATTAVI